MAAAVVTVAAGLTISACGGKPGQGGGSSASGPVATFDSNGAAGTQGSAAHVGTLSAPAAAASVSALTVAGHDLVLTASLAVRVGDVASAVQRTEAVVVAAHGFVATEQVQTDPAHPGADTATMTVRVPEAAYDATITALTRLGVPITQQRTTDDVTDQLIDTSSRLSSAKAGIGRVRTLLDRATSLGQVIDLESELSKREADLESLERRLASLQRQVALATIDVTFTRSAKAAAAQTSHRSGFLAGISGGWQAFTTTVNGLLTAIGAVFPFALALAVLGAAAVLVRRRLRPATRMGDDASH